MPSKLWRAQMPVFSTADTKVLLCKICRQDYYCSWIEYYAKQTVIEFSTHVDAALKRKFLKNIIKRDGAPINNLLQSKTK